ncbi:MAG: molybdopterin-guanine dinucleotide biosynthesis protein B [Syntrophorhabdaceae bacterium]|nr:molybdopterin-guanine dinucleotide biosynthesis protein B [Syntrophorhabdaceae bacterium]
MTKAGSKKSPVIGIAGRSGSGKTTLIERLLPLFRGQGLRVAVIKHTHHELEFDVPGKDSYRFKHAGAATSILVSRTGLGVVKDFEDEPSLDDIIALYAMDMDMVVVEGFKHERSPKIEVFTADRGEPPLCLSGDDGFIAIVTDEDIDVPLPRFSRNDIPAIAQFITSHILSRGIP